MSRRLPTLSTLPRLPRAAALLLPACLALSGCLEATGDSQMGFLSSSESQPREVLAEAAVASGTVRIKPPLGYCLDAKSLRPTRDGGFALVASCQVLSAGTRGASVAPALMTVSVLPRAAGSAVPDTDDLAASFAPARPLWKGEDTGVHMVQLASGGNAVVGTADPRQWRGMMLMNGHLVGMAVYGPEGSPVAGMDGRDLLLALAAGIRNASPTPEAIAAHKTTAREAAEAEASDTRAAISDEMPATIPDVDDAQAAPTQLAARQNAGQPAQRRRNVIAGLSR